MASKTHGSMNPALAALLAKQTPSTLFEQQRANDKNEARSTKKKAAASPSGLSFSESKAQANQEKKSQGLFRRAAIDQEGLKEAALTYLDRYDASTEQVRRVLHRRIFKHGEDEFQKKTAFEITEEVLQSLAKAKLLDDQRFTLNFLRSSRARGYSLQKIRFKLRDKGIERTFIDEALARLEQDEREQQASEEPWGDLAAALIHVRKKRLLRKYDLNDRDQKNKALAHLARQGFSFDIALQALERAGLSSSGGIE